MRTPMVWFPGGVPPNPLADEAVPMDTAGTSDR